MNDDKHRDPNELVALLFGENADDYDGTWNSDLPEAMFYVPGDIELFTYGNVHITADEAFQLSRYTTFDDITKNLWKHQANSYLELTAPELAEDIFADNPDFDFVTPDDFRTYDHGPQDTPRLTFDEIFAARESGFVSDTWEHKFGPFDVPADHRENWENHPILKQVRNDPTRWHLVPDWTGTVGIALTALHLYGWVEYKHHDKIRAYYVKAKV